MTTPSRISARMLKTVCETRVPSRTGNVSRNRPIRRAMIIARAGSPRRAGSVADISTPIIVADVKSRRRSVATGSAERAVWNQAPARKNIDRHMNAVAISTQAKSERTALSTTESKPIRRAARKVSPMPDSGSGPEADPAGDPAAARGRVDRDRLRRGDPRRRDARQPVGGGEAVALGDAGSAGRPAAGRSIARS